MRRLLLVAAVLLAGCSASTPDVVINQATALQTAVDGYAPHYSGEWNPAAYLTSDWEKFQGVAVGDAALAAVPQRFVAGQQASYLQVAVDTVNKAIATHQTLADGDFDNGTPAAGGSGVGGTFWAEAEGLIAVTLKPQLDATTLAAWQSSMRRYADYVWNTQRDWYTNGNVVLRETVVLLETYKLTGDATYWNEYLSFRQFLDAPSTVDPRWATQGWKTSGAAGWYTESTTSLPNTPITCANGMNPCNGFDQNYTAAQLCDASIAYTLSGDVHWLQVIQAENAALQPYINAQQMLNGTGGSRQNVWEPFIAPVYEMLDERSLQGGDEAAWQAQMTTEGNDFSMWAKQSTTPSDNAFSMIEGPALAVIDTEHML